ncbi:sigma-70 family RNA polymerase sigma factor [Gemmata sp.]|uniref:sigma-70 family RNA polymerase sigma factor n=1 Tax=Gemmata sp. TaxID=1914242 RepID=UPI003F730A16
MAPLIRTVCQAAQAGDDRSADGRLLRQYVGDGDRDALAALVHRHSGMVWNVCLRRTGDRAVAEDAFQAVFLALVRSAGQIRDPDGVGGWLHGVAVRLATKARVAARRPVPPPKHDGPVAASPLESVTAAELMAALDDELLRLPEACRRALVAYYLEGLPRDAAAARLGVAPRTLDRRLAEGRELLRTRLSARGLSLPAAFLVVAVVESVVPKRAMAAATGAAFGEPVSAAAAQLASGSGGGLTGVGGAAVVGLLVASAVAGWVLAGTAGGPPTAAPVALTQQTSESLPPGATARLGTGVLRHAGTVQLVSAAPCGRWVASAGADHTVRVWDARTGVARTCVGTGDEPTAVAVAASGRVFVAAAGKLRAWDLGGTQPIATWVIDGPSHAIAVTTDGQSAAAGLVGVVKVVRVGGAPRSLAGPEGAVSGVAFDPSGERVAAVDATGRVAVWDAANGTERFRFARPAAAGGVVALTADAVAAAGLGSVTVWELAAGGRSQGYGPTDGCYSDLAFTPDGKSLVGCVVNGAAYRWDRATGAEVRSPAPGGAHMVGARMAPDVSLAAGQTESSVRVWDPAAGAETAASAAAQRAGPFEPALTVLVGRDGRSVETCGLAGSTLWGLPGGRPAGGRADSGLLVGRTAAGHAVAVPDGRRAVVVRRSDGTVIQSCEPDEEVVAAAVSADGTVIAAVDREGHGLVRAVGGEWDRTFVAAVDASPPDLIGPLSLSHSGDRLAVPDQAGVRVLELPTLRELGRYPLPGTVGRTRFSPDGRTLAVAAVPSAAVPPEVLLYETATGRLRGRVAAPESSRQNPVFEFSPDGRWLAVGRPGAVAFCDPRTGAELTRLAAPPCPVTAIGFDPLGGSVVTASADTTCLVWAVPTRPAPARMTGDRFDRLWAALCDPAPDAAAVAASELAGGGDEAVRRVVAKLRVRAPAAAELPVGRWLSDLDSPNDRVRDAAGRELARNLGAIAPALERAAAGELSGAARARVKQLLDRYGPPGYAAISEVRAVEVIESVGTPAARQAVRELAADPAGGHLRQLATAALSRFKTRAAEQP